MRRQKSWGGLYSRTPLSTGHGGGSGWIDTTGESVKRAKAKRVHLLNTGAVLLLQL